MRAYRAMQWLLRVACQVFFRNVVVVGRDAIPGDGAVLFCGNHPGYIEAMYAAWIAGLAVVPINAKLHAREAQFILADSRTELYAAWLLSLRAARRIVAGDKAATETLFTRLSQRSKITYNEMRRQLEAEIAAREP